MRQPLCYKILFTLCLLLTVYAACLPIRAVDSTSMNRTIRVGWYPAPGLQDGMTADTLSGFNYEYLMRIAQYTNWNYEFVFGDFETLEAQLIRGEIDILGDIAKTDARKEKYDYCTYPSCYSHTLLLCRNEDNRFAYDDYTMYSDMVVGNSGSSFRRSMMDREAAQHGQIVRYRDYPTDEEMLDALDRGDVDTALISNAIQDKSYKILHEWEPAAQYFVVNKGRGDILEGLNTAMENLQSSDSAIQQHLFEKYFGGDKNAFTVALSKEELAAIDSVPQLTVLLAQDQKPLSYLKDGEIQGFIPDYLEVLSQKTGLQFHYVMCRDYEDMIARFTAGEGDLCGQFYETYESGEFKVVQPYSLLSCGFIYNPELVSNIGSVAVEQGNMVLARQLEKLGLQVLSYESPQDCLDAVNARKADAAAMPNVVFEQIAYHEPYLRLIYKAQSNLNLNLCIGVASGKNPLLFGILSKGSGAIAPGVVTHLMMKDSSLKPEYTLRDYLEHNLIFINIIVVLMLIIFFLILWYRRQARFNESLLKATEAKDVFFNNLSHDLRTPLTGILGYSELAIKAKDAAKTHDYLHKIHKSGQLLLTLINDTLSLARIEKGQFTLAPSRINARTFFETLLVPIQSQIQQKKQTFSCSMDIPTGTYLMVDKLKLQDMLLNVLSNAVKYTPNGGHIEFQVQQIDKTDLQAEYHMTVKDNGIGMSPAFQAHLFEPFMQERDIRAEGIDRTGLGLAIVKRIIDLMQGTITVHSVKDKGTEVRITVPVKLAVKDASGQAETATVKDEGASLKGVHILLCEDNQLNREIITELLAAKGIIVDAVENGKVGLDHFAAAAPGTYQVILMDIRMPVMDGYEAATRIRAMDRSDAKTIPILALSADAYEESIRKSLAHGMTAHLTKPIESDKLFAALKHWIIRH